MCREFNFKRWEYAIATQHQLLYKYTQQPKVIIWEKKHANESIESIQKRFYLMKLDLSKV